MKEMEYNLEGSNFLQSGHFSGPKVFGAVYIPDFYNEYESIIPKKICRKWIFESRVTAHPLESIFFTPVISLKSVKL